MKLEYSCSLAELVLHMYKLNRFFLGVGGRVIMLSIGECSVGERR